MTLPSFMRAARLSRFGDRLEIERVPTPTPAPGDIIVRTLACGVCHTDIHLCRGDWRARPTLPFTPGHEIVGEIAAIGEGAQRAIGERVGVFWLNRTCLSCDHCGTGWESLCPDQVNTGFAVPGGFAEFVAVDSRFAIPVPADLDPIQAAPILCAGVSAFKAIRECEVRRGDTIAIVGCGGVGHLAIAYARDAGLHVVALDASDAALRLAHEMGAEEVVDVRDPATVKRLKRTTGGCHAAIVAAGNLDAIRLGVDLLRRRGTAVIVGLPAGDATFPVFDTVVKRLTIRGSIGGTRADVRDALAAAVRADIRPRVEAMPLERAADALDRVAAGDVVGRIVLTP